MSALDLAPLLAPIDGEHRAGRWLRYDAVYADIRRMREADDPDLPQGVWKRELKRADWNGVAARAADALASRSKDLLLAAWLTEAWVYLDGVAGLAAGLRLMAALARGFWSDLYPPLDGESVAARLRPVAWAADKLLIPLKSIRITAAGDEKPLTWADYERALYYENLEKSHPESARAAYANGAIAHERFTAAALMTPASFYKRLTDDLGDARAAVDELEATLDELAGAEETPSFAELRELLDTVAAFAEKRGVAAAPEGDADLAPLREAAEALLRTHSRDELLKALLAVPGMQRDEEEPMR